MSDRLSPIYEIKLAGPPSKTGEFIGYGSTFGGPPDSFGDIIAPGAFTKSLREHAEAGTMPAMLWHHDLREPIGAWLDLSEDDYGLKSHGRITIGTQRGAEAYALLKDGALGLSIGFRPVTTVHSPNARHLTGIQLHEISLVSLPANRRAKVTVVKSKPGRPADIRSFEAQLRDELGFSSRESRRMAGPAWRALERRDDDDAAEVQHVAALLKNVARSFSK